MATSKNRLRKFALSIPFIRRYISWHSFTCHFVLKLMFLANNIQATLSSNLACVKYQNADTTLLMVLLKTSTPIMSALKEYSWEITHITDYRATLNASKGNLNTWTTQNWTNDKISPANEQILHQHYHHCHWETRASFTDMCFCTNYFMHIYYTFDLYGSW